MPRHYGGLQNNGRLLLPAVLACLLASAWTASRGSEESFVVVPDDFQAVLNAAWAEDAVDASSFPYATLISDLVSDPEDVRPPILRAPFGEVETPPLPGLEQPQPLLQLAMDPALGYTGQSGVLPRRVPRDERLRAD